MTRTERPRGGVAADPYEAALNLLREQRRAVTDVRRQIASDEALRAEDPRHQHALMVQTLAEIGQLGAAIKLLEAASQGRVEVTPPPVNRPCVAPADLAPIERVSGLSPRFARPGVAGPVLGRLA